MYVQFVKCRVAERIFAKGALYIKSKALLYGFENRVEPEAFLGSTVLASVKCLNSYALSVYGFKIIFDIDV